MREPGHQSPHLEKGPKTPGNTWHVKVSWYTCERPVFTSTNRNKLWGNLDNANDSCPLNKGALDLPLLVTKVPAIYVRGKCHGHFPSLL